MEESPPHRSPLRNVLRSRTSSTPNDDGSPPPSPRRSLTSPSPAKKGKSKLNLTIRTVQDSEPQQKKRKRKRLDLSDLSQVRINLTRLENLPVPTATVVTAKPKPRDRPVKPGSRPRPGPASQTTKRSLQKSLPLSFLAPRSRAPPILPPTFPGIDVDQFEMAIADVIEISDDELEIPKPMQKSHLTSTATSDPPNPPSVICLAQSGGEMKSSKHDKASKDMSQQGPSSVSETVEAEQRRSPEKRSGGRRNSSRDTNGNSEEIVVSVSAESILAMDQEEMEPKIEVTVDEPVPNSTQAGSSTTVIGDAPSPSGEDEGVNEGEEPENGKQTPPAYLSILKGHQLRLIRKQPKPHTCYICLKTLNSHHEFLEHRRVHTDNKCPDCGKIMGSYKQLKGHVIRKIQKGSFTGLGAALGRPPKLPAQRHKYPPASHSSAPHPSATVEWGNPNGNGNGQVIPSNSWGGSYNHDTRSPPRQGTASDRDFDEVFPPHFMDMDSILDVDKLKDTFDITPLPATQYDSSGMSITPIWPNQLPSTSGTEHQRNGCGTPVSTMVTPPPPAYVIARRQQQQQQFANQAHASNQYPPIPYGNQLRASLQHTSVSGPPPIGQPQMGSFSAPPLLPSSTTTPHGSPYPAPGFESTEYKCYKDLLEPFAKIKKFAMDVVDGPIVYTIHELERHVMTKIMAMTSPSSPTNSTSPN